MPPVLCGEMIMDNTPLSERIKIVITGLRNAGKSSLMNNLFEKNVAIVSDKPGTTTDPVTRTFEMGGLGPVAITDTAGIDDTGELGNLRIDRSMSRLEESDIVIFVTRSYEVLSPSEIELLDTIGRLDKKLVIALTYADRDADRSKLSA